MAVLAGQVAQGTEAASLAGAEFWNGLRVEVLKTGKGEELHLIFAEPFTGTVKLVLAKDGTSPTEPPGAVIAEVEKAVSAVTQVDIPITPAALTAGQFIWLGFWPSTGGKVKLGSTTPRRKATNKKAKFGEVTWGAEEAKGPIAIWVSGTEEGAGETFSGSLLGKLGITGSIQGAKTAVQQLAGRLGLTSTITGSKTAFGVIVEPGFTLPFELPFTLGHFASIGITGTITGRKTTAGTLTGRLAVTSVLTGTVAGAGETFSGSLLGTIAVKGTVQGLKAASGQTTGRVAVTSTVAGRKTAQATIAGTTGLAGGVAGVKLTTGTIMGRVAIVGGPLVFEETRLAEVRVVNSKAVNTTITNSKAVLVAVANSKQ